MFSWSEDNTELLIRVSRSHLSFKQRRAGSEIQIECSNFGDIDRFNVTYETSEKSNGALVYALYKEVCDKIPYEERKLPDW